MIMDKRRLYHIWKGLRPIRPRYFFIAAGVSLAVSGFALRSNYQHMTKLRAAVYQADKDNGDVSKALTNLQHYVVRHMNTDLTTGPNPVYPPIQLQHTYERIRAESTKANNSQIYTQAQAICEQQNPNDFSGRNRVPCIEAYVESHGVVRTQQIPDSLYKFDFLSPIWSPDLAGWSLVATTVFLIAGTVLWIVDRRLKRIVT
jgi:hypothetical protein